MPKKIKFESFKYRFLIACEHLHHQVNLLKPTEWKAFINRLDFQYDAGDALVSWTQPSSGEMRVVLRGGQAQFYFRGDQPIHVDSSPIMWILNTLSVTGSTQPYGSEVKGACVISAVFSQDSPKSHERIGFSIAMKNMHPLEVIPMDGSGPSSPTFENLKSMSIGGRESSFPYLSVTTPTLFSSSISP